MAHKEKNSDKIMNHGVVVNADLVRDLASSLRSSKQDVIFGKSGLDEDQLKYTAKTMVKHLNLDDIYMIKSAVSARFAINLDFHTQIINTNNDCF